MSTPAMTVLFTDMEGSTEITSARGDEVAMVFLRAQERIIRDAARQHAGRVVKSMGDGFLVVFESCTDGVAGALEMRRRLEEHNRGHPDEALRVRFGLNFGSVIEEGGDVFGLAVNAAARIAAKAPSGRVMVSDAVRAEASRGGDWGFVDRGLFWLKGLRAQWRLHEATDGVEDEAAPALAGTTPFVGRERELAILRDYLGRAREGNGAVVVVAGSTGVGKSRLLEELGAEAESGGLQFLSARCDELGQSDPYLPFVEVLDTARRRLRSEVFRECVGEHAGAIARLLPNLRRLYHDVPPPADLPALEERRYLFIAVQEVLARLAAVRPMVIMLDDLHWADPHSLLLLEHLATKVSGLSVLIAGTYTREEALSSSQLHSLLEKTQRHKLVRSIGLDELEEADVGQLLTTIAASAPPPAVVRALYQATKGNPFFLEEVVRQLSEDGHLAAGRWDEFLSLEFEVPENVRLTIEARLEKLDPSTRRVLTALSLLGRDFGFDLLEALEELPEDELVDALDEAERTRLITSAIDGTAVRFAFAHDLIRRTLVEGLSLTRRQRLHVRLAHALQSVHAASLPEHAASIAYHLESAGRWADRDRTIDFLVMAGERALEAAAYEEAMAHFDGALSRLSGDDIARRARVLEGMGTAERSLGHLDRALALWHEALGAMEELGDGLSIARLCLDAAIQVAWWRRGDQTMRLIDRGLLALDDRPSAYRAGFLALAGQAASQSGAYQHAETCFHEALTVARSHHDESMLGLALYSQAAHHFAHHQHPLTVEEGLESIDHLRRAGDLWNLATVLGYVGASLGWLGRFDEAAEAGREGEALAQHLGNWSAYVFAEQSQRFRDVGRNPDATVLEGRGHDALALGDDMGFPWLSSIGHARIGLAAFWRGRWDDTLRHFEDAARLEVRGAAGGHLGRLFLIHAYLGNDATAIELIAQARPQFPVLGQPNSGTSWGLAAAAVEALYVLAEAAEAAALYDVMVELSSTQSLMRSWDYRLLETLLGMSAAGARDWDRSAAHFEHALRLARDLPMRLEELDACRFYAHMLTTRGRARDRDAAEALIERAADGYAGLAMPKHEALARSILHNQG